MNNKIGIIIQARMGSTRLPGKVMLTLGEKPVLAHVVERCKKASVQEVIVATTTNKIDDEILRFCSENNIKCFRGSETNVLDRYYKCAKKFGLKHIIRATADNPLVDPAVINKLIVYYFDNKLDYCRVDTDTYPKGFDCEMFSFKSLKTSFENSSSSDEREHVTIYIRENPQIFKSGLLINKDDVSYIRLTLDTIMDFKLLNIIFSNVKELTFKNIIAYVRNNRKLIGINKDVVQNKIVVNDGSKERIYIDNMHYLVKTNYGFWKLEPRPSKNYLKDFYKRKYSDQLEKLNTADKIDTSESLVKQKSVLDIGCGNGTLLREFKNRGWQVSGIEPSMGSKHAKDLNIISKDLESVKSFDRKGAVILNYVLEHHPDPETLLGTIKRKILKNDGIVAIEVPNDFNELQLACETTGKTNKYWIKFPDHLNYFTFESLRNLLESLGFEVVYQESSFPLEIFILMGDNYVKNKNLGKIIHKKRVTFESNLRNAGKNTLKRKIYQKMAEIGIGRSIIMYAKNK